VIAADGKLERNWIGAYREESQIEIERYFRVRLPGLIQESE
jgi:hypothetical protein